jgi:acetyl-CoA synthetase
MQWNPITQSSQTWVAPPNLLDYDTTCATFAWEDVRRALAGLPGGAGLNMAHEAVDRHANGPRREHLALRWLGKDGTCREFTYGDLQEQSNRFANVLRHLRVTKGERVFVLAGRIPALYIAALGTLKNTSVFCPLFAAFGPEPVYQRLSRGDAKVLVTTQRLYEQKVAGLRQRLPQLQHILLVDVDDDMGEGVWSLPKRMTAASSTFTIPPTDPEDMAVLHFTSGTTGMPKGAIHVHNAVRRTMSPASMCWTFIPRTCSGAPLTRAGSRAPHTAFLRR